MSGLKFCSRCSQPCYDKPGPTSIHSSKRARQRSIIRKVDMKRPAGIKTWFSPVRTKYQEHDAGDIPKFNVWRELTLVEGKNGSCFGK